MRNFHKILLDKNVHHEADLQASITSLVVDQRELLPKKSRRSISLWPLQQQELTQLTNISDPSFSDILRQDKDMMATHDAESINLLKSKNRDSLLLKSL
jgi:hypothetical protein